MYIEHDGFKYEIAVIAVVDLGFDGDLPKYNEATKDGIRKLCEQYIDVAADTWSHEWEGREVPAEVIERSIVYLEGYAWRKMEDREDERTRELRADHMDAMRYWREAA